MRVTYLDSECPHCGSVIPTSVQSQGWPGSFPAWSVVCPHCKRPVSVILIAVYFKLAKKPDKLKEKP